MKELRSPEEVTVAVQNVMAASMNRGFELVALPAEERSKPDNEMQALTLCMGLIGWFMKAGTTGLEAQMTPMVRRVFRTVTGEKP